jgi:hypothetical protein
LNRVVRETEIGCSIQFAVMDNMPEMWQCTAVRILCGKEGRREEILTSNITPASILHAHKNAHHNHIYFSRTTFNTKRIPSVRAVSLV